MSGAHGGVAAAWAEFASKCAPLHGLSCCQSRCPRQKQQKLRHFCKLSPLSDICPAGSMPSAHTVTACLPCTAALPCQWPSGEAEQRCAAPAVTVDLQWIIMVITRCQERQTLQHHGSKCASCMQQAKRYGMLLKTGLVAKLRSMQTTSKAHWH